MAIFQIALNTATGITAALATANIPLAITIGAIGIAEEALAASQKIPQFRTGTMNAPGGLAIVDEDRPEVQTDSQDRVKSWGSEKGANYRHLKPGDKIYKSRDMFFERMVKKHAAAPFGDFTKTMTAAPQFVGLSAGEMDEIMGRHLAEHFSKIQVNKTVIDKNGFSHYIQKNAQKTIIGNARAAGKGFSV
jgi:hypothetical protein